MNNLTSRQRKTACVVGILVLLVPIVILGMPAGDRPKHLAECSLGFVLSMTLAKTTWAKSTQQAQQ